MTLMPEITTSSVLRHEKRPSAVLAKECVLSPDAEGLLSDSPEPAELIAALVQRELWSDALQLLAQALPHRLAVWWGCLCAWHASAKSELADVDRRALESAGRWVLEPNEQHRAVAARLANHDALNRPAGCLVGAVEYTGDAGHGRPEFVGHLVAAAVQMAAVGGNSYAPQFAALALRIANQEIGWSAKGG